MTGHRRRGVVTAIGIVLALAAIAAALWVWLRAATNDPPPAAPVAAATPATVPASASAPVPAPASVDIADVPLPPAEPLPPLDAPLDAVAADLLRRADAGDSAAACRLGIELLRCQQLQELTFGNPNYDAGLQNAAHLAEQGSVEAAEAALRIGERDARRRAACAQLAPATIARGQELLRAAAIAGEPEAQLRYADGTGLFALARHNYITTPEFDRWRREAPMMLRRALAAGRPEAVLLLAGGYGGGDGMIQGLLADDPRQAQAYRLLATRLLGAAADARLEQWRPLRPMPLDAADQADAERLAATWHRELFGDATYAADTLLDLPLIAQREWDGTAPATEAVGSLCGAGGAPP
jgi:hypothetical protein